MPHPRRQVERRNIASHVEQLASRRSHFQPASGPEHFERPAHVLIIADLPSEAVPVAALCRSSNSVRTVKRLQTRPLMPTPSRPWPVEQAISRHPHGVVR
jgi:hypothetical protein